MIKTDRAWRTSSGLGMRNDRGTYDPRLEKRRWARGGYDDGDWKRAAGKVRPGVHQNRS